MGITFGQAYYHAIMAAAIYFIVASMLLYTSWGKYVGRYNKTYKLTIAQRTLMIQTITFLGYILASAAVYSRIEGWGFLDAVYWVDVTLLTVGFGDFAPKTHLGRGLLFPFAVGGILFLGLIIASIRTLVLESSTKKVSLRLVEKTRHRFLHDMDDDSGTGKAGMFKKHDVGKAASSEVERREQEFNTMRAIQTTAANRRRRSGVAISLGIWCVLWFIGALIFWQSEQPVQGWTYFESLYFCYVSLLTIGYGDFYPQDNSSKPFFVLWSLIALPTIAVLIGSIGDTIVGAVNQITIWLGNRRTVSNETGPFADLKRSAARATKGGGAAFESAEPAGLMGGQGTSQLEAGSASAEGGEAGVRSTMDSSAQERVQKGEANSAGRHFHQFLLIKAIQQVSGQVNATPPRRYSYAEWAWFLKLIEQDEGRADLHRRPEAVQDDTARKEENGDATPGSRREGESSTSWSWLSAESPLMGTTDEAQWVLSKLMATLEKKLKEQRHEELIPASTRVT